MDMDLDGLRERLKGELPGRIAQAIASYDAFAGTEPPLDAKGFAAHHAACKSALAHMDLLVKLARWAGAEAANGAADDDGVAHLLAEARAALDDEADDDE